MIDKIRQQLEEVEKVIKGTDFSIISEKKEWRELSSQINPIVISAKLGITLVKLNEVIDMEGTDEDRDKLNYIKEMFNQAFMYSDLSDTTTKAKIFDASGLVAGKGEVKGNVLIVQYSAQDVVKMMEEEDAKRGTEWAQTLKPQ